MKKTYSEIIEVLKSNFKNINYFIDEWFYEDEDELDDDEKELSNNDKHKLVKSILGEWTEIHVSGGCDKGSDWVSVYYFQDHDIYLRVNGYYSSYEGVEFNDTSWDTKEIKEVRPKEVIKVIYE
jgi:hypothetical protein